MKHDFTEDELRDLELALIWASRYHKEFNETIGKHTDNELLGRFQRLINKVNKIRHLAEEK